MMERFRFKQFEVDHSMSAMKIGTDGVLIGAWAEISPTTRRILDVGTGSGIIALMMAQRMPEAKITAVEIDEAAARQAADNVSRSPWPDAIEVVCADFMSADMIGMYDLIVSNPPFFTETLRSPDSRRALARHGDALTPLSLLRRASELVSPEGSIAFIAPSSLDDDISFTASLCRLNPAHITHVSTIQGKQPSRTLWQFTPADIPVTLDDLCIRDSSHNYTPRYLTLVNDFYLWLK